MVSHERTYLTKLREKGNTDPESTLSHLNTLVEQYPYFQALHHLGWKISRDHNLKEEKNLLKTCSLHTKQRLHLISGFDQPKEKENVQLTVEQDVDPNEVRSFLNWLKTLHTHSEPISEEDRLIESFIANAPKRIVATPSEQKPKDWTKEQPFDAHTLMTETLAEVYRKQGKLKKAIKAYEILALKYPEKSAFFADQIRKIKNIKNKS